MTEPIKTDSSGALPAPPPGEHGVDMDVALSGSVEELSDQREEVFLPPPTLPPGMKLSDYVRPATEQRSGGVDHPLFQLPGESEDDPEGASPTMHTKGEGDVPRGLRDKIEAAVRDREEEWERTRVEKAKKYLSDTREIAPDVAKAVKSLVNSFVTEGFTHDEAVAFTQAIIEKKLQPFL